MLVAVVILRIINGLRTSIKQARRIRRKTFAILLFSGWCTVHFVEQRRTEMWKYAYLTIHPFRRSLSIDVLQSQQPIFVVVVTIEVALVLIDVALRPLFVARTSVPISTDARSTRSSCGVGDVGEMIDGGSKTSFQLTSVLLLAFQLLA